MQETRIDSFIIPNQQIYQHIVLHLQIGVISYSILLGQEDMSLKAMERNKGKINENSENILKYEK